MKEKESATVTIISVLLFTDSCYTSKLFQQIGLGPSGTGESIYNEERSGPSIEPCETPTL